MKKNKSLIIKILLFLNFLVVIPLLVSYIAAYISPAKIWHFAFFGLAYPVFLVINISFAGLWLVLWKRYIFISVIPILIGWNNLQSVYPIRLPVKNIHPGKKIKIVSYNVNLFWGNQHTGSATEIRADITSILLSQNADVICLQEYSLNEPDYSKALKAYARKIGMKYYYFGNYRKFWDKKKIDAVIIFSRFPVVDSGFFKFRDKSLFGIFTDIVQGQDTLRIYNLHLESIRFGNDDYSFYSHLADPTEETTPLKEGTKKMFWKLRKAFITRAKEVDTLEYNINACRYPVILAGDFNDTPSSYAYHKLTGKLKDAYISSGKEFFGSTYAGRFPAFRIDYILYSGFFKNYEYQKFAIDLSDHYPIAATFTLNP